MEKIVHKTCKNAYEASLEAGIVKNKMEPKKRLYHTKNQN